MTEIGNDLTPGTDIACFKQFKVAAGFLFTAQPVDRADISDTVKQKKRMFRMHAAGAAVFGYTQLGFLTAGVVCKKNGDRNLMCQELFDPFSRKPG